MSVSRALFGSSLSSEPGPSSSTARHEPPAKPTSTAHKMHLHRNESVVSLPSPSSSPMEAPHPVYTRGGPKGEAEVDPAGPRLEPGFEQDLARGRTLRNGPAFADEEQEDSEDDGDGESGGARLSRAVNPFLVSATEANAEAGSSRERPLRPDHPQASPTHLRRKRIDKDRVQLGAKKLFGSELDKTSPPKVPTKMGKGWEDDANPFIEKKGAPRTRAATRKETETMSWVFRGHRIPSDLPISHLLDSPDSPASPDDAFPKTVPRLLFPPKTPPPLAPASNPFQLGSAAPPSHFVSPKKRPNPTDHGLPTPVQESRKKARRDDFTRNLKR